MIVNIHLKPFILASGDILKTIKHLKPRFGHPVQGAINMRVGIFFDICGARAYEIGRRFIEQKSESVQSPKVARNGKYIFIVESFFFQPVNIHV